MSTVTRTASEIVRNTFNFSVDKFPLSGPDNMATPFYGLFRSDTQDVVSDRAVSKQYVPHTTDDVCALVEAAQSAFDSECVVKCHFRLGHYVSVAPSREHRLSVYGDNDNVFPRIVIRAGYDGRSFKATMGYYRDLCRNLAMMRQVGGTTVTIRHGSGLRSKMDNLINDFRGLGDGWDNLRHRIRRMEDSTVVLDRFLDRLYGQPEEATGRAATNHRNRTSAIFRRVLQERERSGRPQVSHNFEVSAWEAYNAVQGYVQHDARRRKGWDGQFDRILLAARDKHVLQAEQLALELAA